MKSPLSPWLQHKRIMQREWSRAFYARKTSLGLTCRGTVRKNMPRPEVKNIPGLSRSAVLNRFYARRNNAMGLTKAGTPLKSPMNQVETAWRELRASMVLNVPKMMTPMERGQP